MIKKYFGWIKDKKDERDFFYFPKLEHVKVRPKQIDLTAQMPPVYDQGELGSCTAQAIAGIIEYLNLKQCNELWTPSRLFVYYNERVMLGTVNEDSGAMIRDGIKSVNAQGVCKEIPTWPYDIKKFTVKPTKIAYSEALFHQALKYERVLQRVEDIETRIFEGYPIVCGILVYSSFMSEVVTKTGNVPMPKQKFLWFFKGEKLLGGHAILIVGYDRIKKVFICRNSWGDKWGNKGYFTIPYEYILSGDLADDFWTITVIE